MFSKENPFNPHFIPRLSSPITTLLFMQGEGGAMKIGRGDFETIAWLQHDRASVEVFATQGR